MRIGIVAWSLFENKGGIERNSCYLAQDLLNRGHEVWIYHQKPENAQAVPAFPPPGEATLAPLPLNYDTVNLDKARELIISADLDVLAAIFSWESLLWFPGLLKGTGIPLLVSERNRPDRINSKWNEYEHNRCLDAADLVHVLTRGYVSGYPDSLHERIRVVPNPAYLADVQVAHRQGRERHLLFSAGRFAESAKQFKLLIRAFALLQERFSKWDLELCGDGESLADYQALVSGLGLNERVRFPGMVDDMPARYSNADIFCIPSRVEGFPMVVLEAHCFALPVVGFAECSGTNEIVVHGENGYLAEEMTRECLAGYLEKLMDDAELRQRMGKRGKEMLDRYAPEKVYDAWEAMLLEAAKRKGRTRIQEIEAMDGELDADALAVQELLGRAHPFDRSNYLAMHKRLVGEGKASPFSEKEIAGFIKKQKKFGFPGYRSLPVKLKRLWRRLLVRA